MAKKNTDRDPLGLFYLYTSNKGYVYGPGCGVPALVGQPIKWGPK